jgi:hypothetical protein
LKGFVSASHHKRKSRTELFFQESPADLTDSKSEMNFFGDKQVNEKSDGDARVSKCKEFYE